MKTAAIFIALLFLVMIVGLQLAYIQDEKHRVQCEQLLCSIGRVAKATRDGCVCLELAK